MEIVEIPLPLVQFKIKDWLVLYGNIFEALKQLWSKYTCRYVDIKYYKLSPTMCISVGHTGTICMCVSFLSFFIFLVFAWNKQPIFDGNFK